MGLCGYLKYLGDPLWESMNKTEQAMYFKIFSVNLGKNDFIKMNAYFVVSNDTVLYTVCRVLPLFQFPSFFHQESVNKWNSHRVI